MSTAPRTAPTVVLTHGAFTDGASWSPVALRLQGAGVDVRVAAISNRGLAADAAYVRSFVERIDGPVVLVGHSYGATVVGVAGDAENVVALVFVSGYVLEEGESARDLHARFPDAEAVPFFEYFPYPAPDGTAHEEVFVAAEEFPLLAALGVPIDEAAVLAVTQRPLDAGVLAEPAPAAAWRGVPSWGIVAAQDRLINPDAVRYAYQRAGIRELVTVDGPHLLMHTHPAEVAAAILRVRDDFS
ncbi:alpha/beta fold hydrolase [Microbacterium sp. NPDC056044]|uniref:alpha/beta fold hydrolase n=1 Tax=Microbacterium sp. NPDC056044 TaxID=3345690 RepID=UPI0035DAC281